MISRKEMKKYKKTRIVNETKNLKLMTIVS